MLPVAEFVYHDIIEDSWGSQHQTPVEIQIAAAAAASPACFLITDGDVAICDMQYVSIALYPFGEIGACGFTISLFQGIALRL